MSTVVPDLVDHAASVPDELRKAVPDAPYIVAPSTAQEAADVLAIASRAGLPTLIWGGGHHQGYGHPVAQPEVVLMTSRLDRIVDWQPEDLTLVVQGGVPLGGIASLLAEHRQTAVLPQGPATSTVGGAVAAGLSGYRRLRYGPIRDRVLQVTIATGDGRVVTAGGRVVKNVTGYDLPRLVAGSFGSLGVIVEVCLKLWPRPEYEATVAVEDPSAAVDVAYRPLAVLETEAGSWAYLAGTSADVAAEAGRLGAPPEEGLRWPPPLKEPYEVVVRVPPSRTAEAVSRIKDMGVSRYRAAHGAGEVRLGLSADQTDVVTRLRTWAESCGGAVVVARVAGPGIIDPWGTPPASLDLQRAVKAAFDPVGIANPGRLPGGL